MTTPTAAQNRARLVTVLSLGVGLIDAYKDIIGCDHPEASELRDDCFKSISAVSRHVRRLELAIAKMDREQKTE